MPIGCPACIRLEALVLALTRRLHELDQRLTVLTRRLATLDRRLTALEQDRPGQERAHNRRSPITSRQAGPALARAPDIPGEDRPAGAGRLLPGPPA